jgi:hypothetical protein
MTAEIAHKDLIGNNIAVGSYVVIPTGRVLSLGTVTKLNPKMITVLKVKTSRFAHREERRYPKDLLVIDDPKITLYMLKTDLQ